LRKDAAALPKEGPRLRKVDAAAAFSNEGLIESKDTLAGTTWLGCWIPNGTKTLEMYMLALLSSGFHGMYSSSSLIMLVLWSLLVEERKSFSCAAG
jgi:hypothetical protein